MRKMNAVFFHRRYLMKVTLNCIIIKVEQQTDYSKKFLKIMKTCLELMAFENDETKGNILIVHRIH